jgi:predicted nucleotidyltransferase
MSTASEIKDIISTIKPVLRDKYAIDTLYLFGSHARGEQTDQSDIDLLVDFAATPDLLTFIEIEEYLSHRLHETIDLVPRRKLHPQLRNQILQEAIVL